MAVLLDKVEVHYLKKNSSLESQITSSFQAYHPPPDRGGRHQQTVKIVTTVSLSLCTIRSMSKANLAGFLTLFIYKKEDGF